MDEITVTLAEVNPPALDAALRAALGDLIAGLSAARGELRVHFTRGPSPAYACLARHFAERHDAAELSVEQRAEQTRAGHLAVLDKAVAAFDTGQPLTGDALEMAVRWLLLRELGRARPANESVSSVR